jgi:predicted transcriptional regulator
MTANANTPARDEKGRFIKMIQIAEELLDEISIPLESVVEEIEEVEAPIASEDAPAKRRGRKTIFENTEELRAVLADIAEGIRNEEHEVQTSYFLQRKLAEAGLVSFLEIKHAGRGRPRKVPTLTESGVLALAT